MPASNVNQVVITGNLTKDPDLRETSAGISVCELRVAVNSSIKRGDEWESRPNYFQVNAWGPLGENCEKYLHKGSKVAISGRLEWQRWEAEGGGTNSRVVIVAQQVEFLDPRGSREGNKQEKLDESGEEDNVEDKGDDIPF